MGGGSGCVRNGEGLCGPGYPRGSPFGAKRRPGSTSPAQRAWGKLSSESESEARSGPARTAPSRGALCAMSWFFLGLSGCRAKPSFPRCHGPGTALARVWPGAESGRSVPGPFPSTGRRWGAREGTWGGGGAAAWAVAKVATDSGGRVGASRASTRRGGARAQGPGPADARRDGVPWRQRGGGATLAGGVSAGVGPDLTELNQRDVRPD